MHGNPLLRVALLAALLAVAGAVVSAVARHSRNAAGPAPEPAPAAESAPCLLTLQLSAPARSLSLSTSDGTKLVGPHRPGDLNLEFDIRLRLPGREATVLLDVAWEEPSQNRFLRLVLEPEQLESREVIQHAPIDLEKHAITFQWPEPTESPSP